MLVRDRVRQFIKDSFFIDDLGDGTSFLESGIVDSLGVMQIVAFVEREFGLAVGPSDLVPENFDSVDRVSAYVERATAHRARQPT